LIAFCIVTAQATCPEGQNQIRWSGGGKQVCVCPGGKFKRNGLCEVCPAGQFSGKYSNKCKLCPMGTYAASDGSAKCEKCPMGTYSNSGSKRCPILNSDDFCEKVAMDQFWEAGGKLYPSFRYENQKEGVVQECKRCFNKPRIWFQWETTNNFKNLNRCVDYMDIARKINYCYERQFEIGVDFDRDGNRLDVDEYTRQMITNICEVCVNNLDISFNKLPNRKEQEEISLCMYDVQVGGGSEWGDTTNDGGLF